MFTLWVLTVSFATLNDVWNKGSTTSLTARSSNVPIDDLEDLFLACSPIPPKLILRRNTLKKEETYSRLLNKASSWDEDFFLFLTKATSVKDDIFVRWFSTISSQKMFQMLVIWPKGSPWMALLKLPDKKNLNTPRVRAGVLADYHKQIRTIIYKR